MPDLVSPPRLVGQPLLYAISIFASLGVFLVRIRLHVPRFPYLTSFNSLDMTKGVHSTRPFCPGSHEA